MLFLRRIQFLCNRFSRSTNSIRIDTNCTRVILAGELIRFHPTNVLEDEGSLEDALITETKSFQECYIGIMRDLKRVKQISKVSRDIVGCFVDRMTSYFKAFNAWKAVDEVRFANRICLALTTLYKAQRKIPDEDAETKQAIECRHQIKRLRARLVQFKGQAALDEYDANREISAQVSSVENTMYTQVSAAVPILSIEISTDPTVPVGEGETVSNEKIVIQIFHTDSPTVRYRKAFIGLGHALPETIEQQQLLSVLNEAIINGGGVSSLDIDD